MPWNIERIIPVLVEIDKNIERNGRRKPEFTREEVWDIADWLLFKRVRKRTDDLSFRHKKFARNYIICGCNGAAAARMTGYSVKRAKQTAYDLLHPRKRY